MRELSIQVAPTINFLTTESRPAVRTITSVSRERTLPLSYAQERLWRIEQQQPQHGLYNLVNNLRLTGPLSVLALEATLTEIVRRHKVLRTTFASAEGKPVQVVHQPRPLRPELIDISDLSRDEQEIEVSRRAALEAQKPFDLTHGPLVRATLLRLGKEDHIALFTMHQIVSDAWSMKVFVREAAILYGAFSNGKRSPLPELEIQYGDYAAWQRHSSTAELLEGQVAYWQKNLAGAEPELELPIDHPRPVAKTYHGARYPVVIPPEYTEALKELSQREGTTLFMTVLAAFQALLSFHAAQEDISVGTPIANRNRKETQALIGRFANPVVMRTDLTGDPTFRELLQRVRQTCVGAYAHQELPFEKLVEELQVERSESYSPLFQAMFVLDNAPLESPILQGLKIASVDTYNGMALYDLTLRLVETGGEIVGALEYNVDLFDVQTITFLVDHFSSLIRNIVDYANQPLSVMHRYNVGRTARARKINAQPTTETETKALAIWQNALGTRDIGVDDNFFDVGGNSFLLAKIHTELRATIAPDVPLMDLFEYPTIRSLVRHIDRQWPSQTSFDSVYERMNKGKEAFLRRMKKVEERRAFNV
jgi:Condensation domain/Phosphopantetheine attachment site